MPPMNLIDCSNDKKGENRPILLCLHGFMGKGSDWSFLAPYLPHYQIVAPDLAGHGTALGFSDAIFTIDGATEFLIKEIDRHDWQKIALLGYSMGGRLALYLAVHHPHRLTQLILESASPGLRTSEERAKRRIWDDQMAQQLLDLPYPDFLDQWYRLPLFATFRAHSNYQRAFAAKLSNDSAELARSLRLMGTGSQPSLWEAWTTLDVPTLLVTGEADEKYCTIAEEMAQINPHAMRASLPNTGHNTHWEQPQLFAEQIGRFLR